MQSQYSEYQFVEVPEVRLDAMSGFTESNYSIAEAPAQTIVEPTQFHSHFIGRMEMNADAQTVAQYLDTHRGWFCRCAQPMKVEPIGESGYALAIGRFGSFGYEVEPKIGLNLLPQDQGTYRIKTIPVPNYTSPGYDVDFQAAMELIETPAVDRSKMPSSITQVEWHLDLTVTIQFPRFIHRLPKSMIQSTGDRLLSQIVRQISRRLTCKVQEDFHASVGGSLPQDAKKKRP